mgnify:CR=1 FL=1
MDRQAVTAFLMSLIAGLSTGLGGLIVVFSDGTSTAFLSFALAFSAGIMVTVSLADLLPTAAAAFVGSYGPGKGAVMLLIPMVMGIFFAQLIDALTPEAAPSPGEGIDRRKLGRLGVISAAAILLHNLPEGMVTFMAGYTDLSLGLSMMAAIALHNIPEGMSVSIPIYYSTKSRWKAVRAAFLSDGLHCLWRAAAHLPELRPVRPLPLGDFDGHFGDDAGGGADGIAFNKRAKPPKGRKIPAPNS